MVAERWARKVANLAKRERSRAFKFGALALGATVFLVLLPALLIAIAKLTTGGIDFGFPRGIEGLLSALCLGYGLFWVVWATLAQWRLGHGTPAPIAPTRTLVISGPYRYCRNPILLGAFHHAGLAVLFGAIVTGARFGEEYEHYKAQPFGRRRR